jgi:hypothetical protein
MRSVRAPDRSNAQGVTQNQVVQAWGVHSRMLNMLELEGKLSPIQVGQRLYYRLGDLVELFGEPVKPDALRRKQNTYFRYGSTYVA